MRIEDTAGNVYIKPENCDCGLTGGCDKCRGVYIPKNPEYYCFPQYYPQIEPEVKFNYHFHDEMFEQIRCPFCGKTLKAHICGKKD